MKAITCYIVLFFLFLNSGVYSQQHTNYTTKDGLPSNHVYRITQDHQGFIWFITDKGMVKYDGTTFKTFTTKEGLPTNDIWNIRITPDNKVWFFSKAAKLGYIENDQVFAFESSLIDEILYPISINQNENDISFSNSNKNYRLKNKKWHAVNLENNNSHIHRVFHSQIKYILDDRDSQTLKLVDKHDVILKEFVNPVQLQSIRTQLNDSLYLTYNRENYTFINLNRLNIHTKNLPISQKKSPVNYTRWVAVNDVIFFTGSDFLGKLTPDYTIEIIAEIPARLNSHFSFQDKNKNLWIATEENGVYFISKAKRKAFNLLKDEKVGKLNWVNGKLIASVRNKGFYQYNPKTQDFSVLYQSKGVMFSASFIKELQTSYYSTNTSIIQNKKHTKKTYIFPNKSNEIARQFVYYQNQLYGNSSYGVNKLNPKSLKIKDAVLQYGIRHMLVFNDQLLLATSNGLKKLENKQINFVFPKNKKFNKPLLYLVKITEDQLLICTDGFGAYISNLKSIELVEETEFLSVQNAYVRKDELWLATTQGVWYYVKKENTYKLIKKYTVNDGLSSNLINDLVILEDKIIATSNDGIAVIPIFSEKEESLNDLYFNSITYNNQPLASLVSYTTNNHLNISVAAIDFSETKAFNYSYQLLPIQKKWATTASNQISFNDLPPNTYQLNIKSKGKNKSLSFKIKPLWYQTLLTKVLFGLFAVLVLLGIVLFIRKRELKKQAHKLNTKRKLAEFELHALRSQMNPHFVFNSLNAIQFYMNDNKIELSEKYLIKFSKLVRMFFDFSKQAFISIEAEIKLLKGYLEIEKLRFGKDFNFKISIKNELNIERKIPVMLLQPIVENAVNHGLFHKLGKGLISVVFKKIDEVSFEVSVEDDGIGREQAGLIKQQQSGKHLSKSTHIIKDRIALLNESNKWEITYSIVDLNTKEKTGTRVTLVFKQP